MSYFGNVARAVLGPLVKPTPQPRPPSRRASGWSAAMNSRRFIKWAARREALNTLIYQDGEKLRDRARDAGRQNPWAASAIDSMTANVIGTGIKPQSRHSKKEVRETLHKLWELFVMNADADGRSDFYGLQALAFRSVVEAGEIIGRVRYRRSYDNFVIPFQYQLLEADYLPLGYNGTAPNGNTIQAGIEFDKIGARSGYYLYNGHPNDYVTGRGLPDLVRVKADQIDHVYKMLRPTQIRGVTWLAPALPKLYDINEYDDAELLRKKFAAMFVGFITENDSDDPVVNTTSSLDGGGADPVTDESGADANDDQGVDFAEMQAGTMMRLNAGEGIEFSKPEDVGGMYPDFMRQQLLAVAAALGCMYESMTGNVSDVNYSSIRSQVIEFRRKAEQWQFGFMCHQMCQPVWERFIRASAVAGLIDANDFAKNPADYLVVDWRTPLWEWVDPEKDIKAEIMAIRAGLKSRTASIAERGEDPEIVDAQIQADNERADAGGMIFDSDPRQRDSVGRALLVPSPTDPQNDPLGDPPKPAPAPEPAKKSKAKTVIQ